MLIEHPEDGIHTGLVTKLLGLLRASLGSTQVIMSTHSLTLMNYLEPFEIRFVDRHKLRKESAPLNKQQLAAAKTFITEDGGNLADFIETVENSE